MWLFLFLLALETSGRSIGNIYLILGHTNLSTCQENDKIIDFSKLIRPRKILELEKAFFKSQCVLVLIKKVVLVHSNVVISFYVSFRDIREIDWYHLHHPRIPKSIYMAGKWQKRRFFKMILGHISLTTPLNPGLM